MLLFWNCVENFVLFADNSSHMCAVYLLRRGKNNLLLNLFTILLICFFNGSEDAYLKCFFFPWSAT